MIPFSFVPLTCTSNILGAYLLNFGESISPIFLNMENLKASQRRDSHIMNPHAFITYPQ